MATAVKRSRSLDSSLQGKKSRRSEQNETSSKVSSDLTEEILQPKAKKCKYIGYVKPDSGMLDKERDLQRTATKGVIQLFNAVSKQKKMIESKLKDTGGSEFKKSRVLNSIDKKSFVEMLKGKKKDGSENGKKPTEKPSESESGAMESEESAPKWDILRTDFMLGASMKDWDKTDSDLLSKKT